MGVCDHNIDQTGRNRRMLAGLVFYSIGLVLAVVLVKSGLPVGYRALAFLPFMAGSLLVFQAAYRTCVMLAVRHERATQHGIERVVNREQIRADTGRMHTIYRVSILVSLAATAVLFLVP